MENKKTLEKEEEKPRLITPLIMDALRDKLEEIRIESFIYRVKSPRSL